jgi:hypothetical protein
MASMMMLGNPLRTMVFLVFHNENTNTYEKSDH